MSSRRGVVASVLRTLCFHLATLMFAIVLGALFCVTGSSLLLFVGCLVVGSSQYARRLTRFLWRTEMRIDALVAEEGELGPGLNRRVSSSRGHDEAEQVAEQQQSLGEVTVPVMLLSLLYFLVFKWVMNICFTVVPLALWVISVAQLVPVDSPLGAMNLVANSTHPAQVFTALAFAFLAHQSGVTSARVLLYVSRNVSGMLFSGVESDNEEQQDRTPLASQRRTDMHVMSNGSSVLNDYGTMGGGELKQPRRSSSAGSTKPNSSAEAVVKNLYQRGRKELEPDRHHPQPGSKWALDEHAANYRGSEFPYVPPMMTPSMPGIPPPHELPDAERAFRNDHQNDDRELRMCGCKIVIKTDDTEDTETNDDKQERVAGARRGGGVGRRNSFGRGGLGWGRGGGRAGFRLDRMPPLDPRGPPPFPSFNDLPPWGGDWRERWLNHWSHWHDWRWPGMDQRGRRTRGRERRRMRRRNSFDDVYAVAIPVAVTDLDAEDEGQKEPAHKSMYEALDLTPSAPPLASLRPRGESDEARWMRPTSLCPHTEDDHDHHPHHSIQKSMSEPCRHHPLPKHYDADSNESDEDEDDDDDETEGGNLQMARIMDTRMNEDHVVQHGQNMGRDILQESPSRGQRRHRRLTGRQNVLSKATGSGAMSSEEMGSEASWESNKFGGASEHKHHQARTQRKQKRYDKKLERYEEKLRITREKSRQLQEAVDTQERYIQTKERDRYAKEIEQAADEAFHTMESFAYVAQGRAELLGDQSHTICTMPAAAAEPTPVVRHVATSTAASTRTRRAPFMTPDGDPRKRALSSRVRSRPSVQTDNELRAARGVSEKPDTVESHEQEDKRFVSVEPMSQSGSTHNIDDYEIQGHYGNISRSYEEDDVTNMRAYAPLSFTGSPPQYITALDTGPIYRGPGEQTDYDSFSPVGSPRSIDTGRDSLMEAAHDYDLLSPTNSIHDAEFPTDKFQQVYRSIQSAAMLQPRHSESHLGAEEGGLDVTSEFEGVPGRRDRVNFSAFAPPSVCPSPKPFQFTVWAFLLNQRAEMREQARSDHPASRKLSLEAKLNVRRGALVHVTLEVPTGFRVLNGTTQGFSWEGDITNTEFDVECTEGATFGRVLFKARITVGSSVAVLNSFVLVGSRALDPSELEPDVLEGWMDVMEQTYREIPFRSLEMKELVGQGYFGDAYRASLDGKDVVVKTIRASEFGETTSQIVREFQHEAAMLNMFGHHPCIVPFVGASTDTKFPLALVTEYLPYGSLEDNLRGSNSAALSIDERTGMLKDAAAGLINIHEGGFIHRDLAARNCLVDKGRHVRICDFGLCRRVRSETFGMLMKDTVGPVKYMAPESLQPPHAFSYDSDVYMFGVLMWETYTGSPPFASLTPVEAMMRVLGGERLPVPNELPDSLQTLMQNCFHDSPAERPSMEEVLMVLDDSLHASERATSAIAAATAATATAMANSVSSRASLRKEQGQSIWV